MAKRILLIGAGLTSAIIANVLKRSQINNSLTIPIELYIWEKSRGAGGRFSTSRSSHNANCTADLGAQYLTGTLSNVVTQPYFEDLIKSGLISKFSTKDIPGFLQSATDKENYVCSNGTASVVKHLLHDIKNISFNKRVASISVTVDGRIKVVPEGQSESDIFDVVVSTIPVPQLLQLENMDNILQELGSPDLKKKLSQVSYTSRYALGLFYNEKLAVDPTESCINFVDGNPMIRYWTLEDEKRKLGETNRSLDNNASSAVVHTSVSFGAENIDRNAQEVQEILLKSVAETCKSLQGQNPAFVKCHKWRYSQISKGYEGSPGFVVLSKSPIILAAGDGFVQSGFENCILSGEQTAQYLVESMK